MAGDTQTTIEIRSIEEEVAGRFRRDTETHEMTVLHDDGLYRHIRFRAPDHGSYWFELITVPGVLIFQGDGATCAFRRIEDMFQFFGGPVGSINPQYWAEKLTGNRDTVMRYDERLFELNVADYLAETEAEKNYPGVTEAWKSKFDGAWADYSAYTEEEARAALDDFEFGAVYQASCACGASKEFAEDYGATRWRSNHITPENARRTHRASVERVEGFRFTDTGEWDLTGYSWWFLWACHAIVWGIAQYVALEARVQGHDAQPDPRADDGIDHDHTGPPHEARS